MNAQNTQIGEWLGLQPPAREIEILQLVERQFATSVIQRLLSLGLERAELLLG